MAVAPVRGIQGILVVASTCIPVVCIDAFTGSFDYGEMATEADHSAISPDFVRDRCEKSGFLFGVYGYCVPSSDRRSRAVFC